MNYAKAEMWKAEKSRLNHVKRNLVKQISGFASRAASVGKKSDKKVGFVRFLLLNRLCMVEVTLLGHELQGQSWYTS